MQADRSEIIGFNQVGVLSGKHSPRREEGVLGPPYKEDVICRLVESGWWLGAQGGVSVCTGHQKEEHLRVNRALGWSFPFLGLCSTTENPFISTPSSFHLTPFHPLEEK